jgi:hypothetical protein
MLFCMLTNRLHRNQTEKFLLSVAHAQIFISMKAGVGNETHWQTETLLYGAGVMPGKLHSMPAGYVLDLLAGASLGWKMLIECCRRFLSRMVVSYASPQPLRDVVETNPCGYLLQKHEILEESAVSDRQIIRRLARNAQQWEWLRSLHRNHLRGLSRLQTLNTEGCWFERGTVMDETPEELFSEILEAVRDLELVEKEIEYLIKLGNQLIDSDGKWEKKELQLLQQGNESFRLSPPLRQGELRDPTG